MFTVMSGDLVEEYEGRAQAIGRAKELSGERHGKVGIEDGDGRESFVYRGGELESYVYNLRDRRRRRDD